MDTSKKPPEKKDAVSVVEHKMPSPLINTMEDLHLFSAAVFKSQMWAGIKNPETAMVRIQAGRELGLQPIMALNKIHVTPRGDIIIATSVLGAVAMDQGVRWQILQKDPKGCKLKIYRLDGSIPEHTETFTMEDAKRAKLADKDNYLMYPEEMCYNRCLSKGLRVFDPRIGAGFYTKEEMEDAESQRFGEQNQRQQTEIPEEEEVLEGEIVEEEDYEEEMSKAMDREEDPPVQKADLQEEARSELNESPEVAAKKKEDIEQIRKHLMVLELDKKRDEKQTFKEWLVEKQKNKIFLRKNKFGHHSFHLGDAEAIDELNKNRQVIVTKYVEAQFKLMKPGERIGCFVVPQRRDDA